MGLAESITNINTVPIENDKVIDYLKEVKRRLPITKSTKYKNDGSIKNIPNNKLKGKPSEVFPFRTKQEIDSILNVINEHIKNATTFYNKKRWIY